MRFLLLLTLLASGLARAEDGPAKPPTHILYATVAAVGTIEILVKPVKPAEVLDAPNPDKLPWIKTRAILIGHPEITKLADGDRLTLLVRATGRTLKRGRHTLREYRYHGPAPQ
jgi:hypothetical protein